MRKTREMSIRSFIIRLSEMNYHLTYFPPFGDPDTQMLAQDGVIDIIVNSVPNK